MILAGMLADRMQAVMLVFVTAVFTISGLVAFAMSDETGAAMVPGVIALSAGGTLTLQASFRAAFVVPRWQNLMLTSINCLFDASGVICLLVLEIHRHTSFNRLDIFIGLSIVAFVIYLLVLISWLVTGTSSMRSTTDVSDESAKQKAFTKGTVTSSKSDMRSAKMEPNDRASLPPIDVRDKGAVDQAQSPDSATLSFQQQISSREFWLLTCFASIHALRSNWYLGVNKDLLRDLGAQQDQQ